MCQKNVHVQKKYIQRNFIIILGQYELSFGGKFLIRKLILDVAHTGAGVPKNVRYTRI